MNDGFAVLNQHEGGIRSGLSYYVRTAGGTFTYDYGNLRQDLYSGNEGGYGSGSHFRVYDGTIYFDSDTTTVRNDESLVPRVTVTGNASTPNSQLIQYSSDSSSYRNTITTAIDDSGDVNITTNGRYDLTATDSDITFNTINANGIIGIGTHDYDTDITISTHPTNTVTTYDTVRIGNVDGDVTKSVPITFDSYGYVITMNGSFISDNDINLSPCPSLTSTYIFSLGTTAIGSDANNAAINIGTQGTRTITLGDDATSTIALNGAEVDVTNGGIAMPANGPNGSANISWIDLTYTSPTIGPIAGKIFAVSA